MKSKNKLKLKKNIKFFLIFSIFSFLFCVLLSIKNNFFIFNERVLKFLDDKKVELEFSSIFSNQLKDELLKFVDLNINNNSLTKFDFDSLSNVVKEKFKIIKKIECDFLIPKIAKLKIQGVMPFCIVNEKFILGDNNIFFDFKYFKDFDIKGLRNINIAECYFDNNIKEEMYAFLEKISLKMWSEFNLYYSDNFNIILCPKISNQNKYFLIFDELSFLKTEKLNQAFNIESLFEEDFSRNVKNRKENLFDLRFKNRIFVRPVEKKIKQVFDQTKNMGRG